MNWYPFTQKYLYNNIFYNFIEDCHLYISYKQHTYNTFCHISLCMFICYLVITLGSFQSICVHLYVYIHICKYMYLYVCLYIWALSFIAGVWGKIGFLYVLTSKFITNHKIFFPFFLALQCSYIVNMGM